MAAKPGETRTTHLTNSAGVPSPSRAASAESAELIVEDRFALHHGETGQRPDIAKPEHARTVCHDRNGVVLDGQVPDRRGIVRDRLRDACDTRRVRHRKVIARLQRSLRRRPRACRPGASTTSGRRRARPSTPSSARTASTIRSRCPLSDASTLTSRIFFPVLDADEVDRSPAVLPASPIASARSANEPGRFVEMHPECRAEGGGRMRRSAHGFSVVVFASVAIRTDTERRAGFPQEPAERKRATPAFPNSARGSSRPHFLHDDDLAGGCLLWSRPRLSGRCPLTIQSEARLTSRRRTRRRRAEGGHSPGRRCHRRPPSMNLDVFTLPRGPPSTSGLGHHPFKVAARVRIPLRGHRGVHAVCDRFGGEP